MKQFGKKQLREVAMPGAMLCPDSGITYGTINGLRVLYSYETPVAIFAGARLFVTKTKHSNTTTRHVSFYANQLRTEGHTFKVVQVEQCHIDATIGQYSWVRVVCTNTLAYNDPIKSEIN